MRSNQRLSLTILCSFLQLLLCGELLTASDLDEGVQELAQQISVRMATADIKKIAIVEFSDLDGSISAFGQFLAEELTTALFVANPDQFEVVERRQLMRVLQEQQLSLAGLFDNAAIENLGKILGIEALVTGSIADLGNDVKVNARLIAVDTARVFAVAATRIPKVGTVERLVSQEAEPALVLASASKTTGSAGRRSQQVPRAGQGHFQNAFLRAEARSLSLTADYGQATLALRIENTTDADLGILLNASGDSARLIDNRGNSMQVDDIAGVSYTSYYKDPPREQFSILGPGTATTAVFVFEKGGGGIRMGSRTQSTNPIGTRFAFSADFYKLEADGYSRFSVGLSDLVADAE